MRGRLLAAALSLSLCAGVASAQNMLSHPRGQDIEWSWDSGAFDNNGKEPALVATKQFTVFNARWLRLFLAEPQLPEGSFVRVFSMLDGEVQTLDAAAAAMWTNSTAFFNGDSLWIEVWAGPETQGTRVVIDRAFGELMQEGDPGQCGICSADDRTPSAADWSARIMPVGCSATVYCRSSSMVTAGHCLGGTPVVQFRVPASLTSCATVNPGVDDQFPVLVQNGVNGGVGNDYGVLTLGTNGLGQTPFHRYNVVMPLGVPQPAGSATSMRGYGLDTNCVRSQTQQLSPPGSVLALLASSIQYNADVRGGNSGSGLLNSTQSALTGVVTHCQVNCPNHATRIDLPAFVNLRNSQAGVCNSTLRLVDVQSTGATGAGIAVNTADVNNLQNGTSNFKRVYVNGANVTFTAPANAGGNCFSRWVLNGSPLIGNPVSVAMTADQVLVAEYTSCGTVPNDLCASAADVSAGGSFSGTLVGATNDAAAGGCGSATANPDVWYTYTAGSCPGVLTVSTCGSHDFNAIDTVLTLHSVCGGTELSCSDDYLGTNPPCADAGTRRDSLLQRSMAAGETVKIRVSKYLSTALLPFTLNVSYNTAPANDTCAGATPVSDGVYPVNTCGANTEGFAEAGFTCFGRQIFKDVWYSYTAALDSSVTVTTCGNPFFFDTMLAAYTACPAGVNAAIACNDDAGCAPNGLLSSITFNAAAGSTTLIRLGGFNGQGGVATMTVSSVPTGCQVTCDYNQDGGADNTDVSELANAIASGTDPYPGSCTDYNQDGGADNTDVSDIANAIASGTCP